MRALDELSEAWPEERTAQLTATPGSRDLSVAALTELVRVLRVEWPVGSWPREYVQFSLWGTTLTLETENKPAAADQVNVYWGRRHSLERLNTTLPVEAEETLLVGAAGFALEELAQYGANRANTGGPQAVREYRGQAVERLREFRRQLRRFGSAGSLQTASLYAPAQSGAVSQTRDPGPA